jgi:hypothetical protein
MKTKAPGEPPQAKPSRPAKTVRLANPAPAASLNAWEFIDAIARRLGA